MKLLMSQKLKQNYKSLLENFYGNLLLHLLIGIKNIYMKFRKRKNQKAHIYTIQFLRRMNLFDLND